MNCNSFLLYIEEFNGQLSAFEIKWNSNKKVKFSKTFTVAYPDAKLHVINPDNIWDFIGVWCIKTFLIKV